MPLLSMLQLLLLLLILLYTYSKNNIHICSDSKWIGFSFQFHLRIYSVFGDIRLRYTYNRLRCTYKNMYEQWNDGMIKFSFLIFLIFWYFSWFSAKEGQYTIAYTNTQCTHIHSSVALSAQCSTLIFFCICCIFIHMYIHIFIVITHWLSTSIGIHLCFAYAVVVVVVFDGFSWILPDMRFVFQLAVCLINLWTGSYILEVQSI